MPLSAEQRVDSIASTDAPLVLRERATLGGPREVRVAWMRERGRSDDVIRQGCTECHADSCEWLTFAQWLVQCRLGMGDRTLHAWKLIGHRCTRGLIWPMHVKGRWLVATWHSMSPLPQPTVLIRE